MSAPLPILYQGASLVAVHKPSALAVHRGWAQERDYAMTRVRDQLGQYVYPVHRLDRATSGVLLFALTKATAAKLQHHFASGVVQKTYLTLVRGHLAQADCIDHPLKKDGQSEAKAAQTRFIPIGTLEGYAWALARPKQGRQHQIRRHFKHISRHLIGDVRYGKGEHNRYARESYGLHRLALHALSIRLPDPDQGDCIVQGSTPNPEKNTPSSDHRVCNMIEIKCPLDGSLAQTLLKSMSRSELWLHWDRAQRLWSS